MGRKRQCCNKKSSLFFSSIKSSIYIYINESKCYEVEIEEYEKAGFPPFSLHNIFSSMRQDALSNNNILFMYIIFYNAETYKHACSIYISHNIIPFT